MANDLEYANYRLLSDRATNRLWETGRFCECVFKLQRGDSMCGELGLCSLKFRRIRGIKY